MELKRFKVLRIFSLNFALFGYPALCGVSNEDKQRRLKMKNWMKQQVTEITFWAGLVMVVGYFILPKIIMLIVGVLLIAIDDVKARKWIDERKEKASAFIDRL